MAEEAKKKSGSYEKPDVVERLRQDFHDKCYICEIKPLQDPQVEHLLPHQNGRYPDRKFDWDNLFWVCGHCNGVKNQEKYAAGILNCCKTDPENKIVFRLKEKEIVLEKKESGIEEATMAETDRTISLIYEVFHLQNTGMRVYKSAMRLKALQKEMNLLFDNLEQLKKNPKSRIVLYKVKALLRRESAFAAFKRCYVREHLLEYPELEHEMVTERSEQI